MRTALARLVGLSLTSGTLVWLIPQPAPEPPPVEPTRLMIELQLLTAELERVHAELASLEERVTEWRQGR